MVHVVALRARGGHDGGVGDGGAVVAAHRPRHAGGDADDGHGIAHVEHVLDDGDQDAEGAPGGAGGKGQQAAHREHDDGQQHLDAGGGADKVPDEVLRAQGVGHALQAPGEGEDQDGGHHGLEALGDTAHDVPEGHGPAGQVVEDGEHQPEGGAKHQAHGGVGVGEGHDEVVVALIPRQEEIARVDHADNAGRHQHRDGQHQIQHGALALIDLVVHHGVGVGAGEQVPLLHGVALIGRHGAEIGLEQHQPHHHHNGEQGVEVIRDGPDEQVQPLPVLGEGGHGGGPGGDGGDDADGGGGGVDEVGQLGPGHLVLVGDGPHDRAYGEAVEVVVDEDQAAQHNGGDLRPHPGLDVLLRPSAEGGGASRLVHHAHNGPQYDQKHQDAHIVAVGQGGHDPVAEGVGHRALKGEVGVQQAARQNADKQGGIDLLGDQRQGDGDHRGQQGPRAVEKGAGRGDVARVFAVRAGFAGDGPAVLGQHHPGGSAVGALDVLGSGKLGGVLRRGEGGQDGEGQRQHGKQREQAQAVSSCSHFFSSLQENTA